MGAKSDNRIKLPLLSRVSAPYLLLYDQDED
jgi:hypothetical protein